MRDETCWIKRGKQKQMSVHMGTQVRSPIHVSKSQYGDKIHIFEPQKTSNMVFYHYSQILINLWKTFSGFVLRVRYGFWFESIPNRNSKPHLREIVICRQTHYT